MIGRGVVEVEFVGTQGIHDSVENTDCGLRGGESKVRTQIVARAHWFSCLISLITYIDQPSKYQS